MDADMVSSTSPLRQIIRSCIISHGSHILDTGHTFNNLEKMSSSQG